MGRLHRYSTEFGYRYNNREETGVAKFHLTVAGSGKKRLSYEKLIGRQTTQSWQQKVDKGERDILKNPPIDTPDWHDAIDPDSTPIVD